MRLLSALFALLLVGIIPAAQAAEPSTPAAALSQQNLAGDWDAVLVAGTQNLPLAIHIGPGPSVTMDSPHQGMSGQAMSLGGDGQTLVLTLDQAGAVFTLKPAPDGQTLAGALSQSGANLPVTFTRRPAGAPAPALVTPSPTMASDETSVQVAGPLGAIKGTMTLTSSPPKAVAVLIQGSGPVDRDGNAGPSLKAASSRLLAQALAAQGIQTVRYDKRGMYAGSAAILDGNKVTIEDYAEDTRAFAALAAQRASLPCAWLIGHSEGALVALAAAQQPTKICGVISLAGPGRNLGEVLRDQIAADAATAPPAQQIVAQAQLAQASAGIARLQAGRKVDTTHMPQGLLGLFAPEVQDFLIDEFRYKPPALVAAYKGPVLVVQGDSDLNISLVDADRLATARPDVQKVVLSGMNHVLKAASSARAINLATYADPSLPLAPGLSEAIVKFILGPRP